MNNKLRRILRKIEEKGFEAYIVGGYVRDHLLGIESTDIDICTNALPKDIIKIFNVKTKPEYGSISLTYGKYIIDITTYRKETDYINRRPQKVEYVDNLITDIHRRDFTINSLCMNSTGQILDLLNGKEDIEKHLIRVIGDIDSKLTEDPLRILRAIRFGIILNFEIDPDIISFIKNNKYLIKSLSFTKKSEELNKIFSSKNAELGLKKLKELELLDVLGINYNNVRVVPNVLGIWAQIDFDENYTFSKNNLEVIKQIRDIITKNKFDKFTLFSNTLYDLIVAGEIMGYNRKEITKMYSDLPINNKKDLKITAEDILKILNIKPSKQLKIIYDDLINKILSGELKNNFFSLKKYIINKWK